MRLSNIVVDYRNLRKSKENECDIGQTKLIYFYIILDNLYENK